MSDIQITKLLPEHAHDVARLHVSGIHTGFISSLGINFVTALYEAIATRKSAFGYVAIKDSKVVGFVVFTTNVADLYRSVLFIKGLKLAFGVTYRLFSFSTLKKICETLFYPGRLRKLKLPSSELLSIAVSDEARGKGIATELLEKGLEECEKRNIANIKVLVGSENIAANRLYLKYGFELITQINNHGVLSNIYVTETLVDKSTVPETKEAGEYLPVVTGKSILAAFVTYGWCRSSYTVVQSLGKQGIEVHVGDTSPFAMSRYSRYCKSFTKLPDFFLEPEKYFDEVCRALDKTGAKVLIPCHEDVGIFAQYRDRLPRDISLSIPQVGSYRLAEDKFDLLELAKNAGCSVPYTIEVTAISELEDIMDSIDLPVVIKARVGNSAKGVRIARSKKDLIKKYNSLVETFDLKNDRLPIIQEFLPGAAAGVCLLYEHGQCKASFAEEYLRCKNLNKFGTSTLRETLDDKELISQAVSVMDGLNWHGVAHLDFVADREGNFKLIEINPRLWGALSLAVNAGIDFPYLWYKSALGEKIAPLDISNARKIKSRWVVGDCLAFFEFLRHGRFLEAVKIFRPYSKCYHDDFNIKDPLPFVFEILDYLTKFIKAGFSTNPVTKNMVR